MTVYVSLLRAVNVGGRFIKMVDLVALFADIGFPNARTHLQSGNVVFDAGRSSRTTVAGKIEVGIQKRFGFHSDAILRTGGELREAIEQNPFPEMAQSDPSHLIITFLAGAPTRDDVAAVAMEWDGPEEWQLIGRELFIAYGAGMGRSKLKLKLKTPGTQRNWNVVNALAKLASP